MRDYSDIVNKAKKKKREEEETKSSSSSNFYDATSVVEKTQLGKRINFETLESDLFDLGTTIGNIYGGWQTQETMANTRSAIESMNQRLGYYQTYQSKYGGTDMTEVANGYKSVLDDWDNLSSTYGYYQDADAFNKARTKAVLDKQFSGLSYDEVQKQLGQYKEGSDEYEYLKKYTNYSDLKDFDKAIEAEKYITDVPGIVGSLDIKDADREAVEKTIAANKAKMKNKDADKDYINALETAKKQHALDHKFDLYKDYLDAEDFDEMSQYKNTAKRDGVWAAIGMNGEDETYEYINDVDGARQRIIGKYKDSNDPIDLETRGFEYMTDEEKAVYNYKYRKEGKKSADAFLKDLEVSLSKRLYGESTEKWEEWSDDGFWQSAGLTAATPILNIAGSIGSAIDTVGEFVKGEEYNPYSALRMASNATSDIRQYVGENIAEETEGMEIFGQNIPQFLYHTGMSIADTAVGSQMFGAGFSAVMGMSSAQQRAKELKEAGASSAEIARGAVASGVFEMVFEKLSLDNLIKVKGADSIGKIVTETLKQAGIEASEEIATEVSNILFDTISRGKNSDAYKMYEELLERGFSKSEAGWKLAAELGGQVAWAGIGGALSGTAMGNVSSASDYVQNRRAGNQIIANDRVAEMFDTSKLTPEESEAYKLYDAYAKKGVNAETASNAQVGNLYRQTQSEAVQTLKSRKSTAEQKADAVKTLDNLNTVETSKPEEERARQQRVKDLAKSETTMVNGETAKIEGIKVEDGATTLLTSQGEALAEDMTFSANDAEIVSHAEIMGNDKGNLFVSQYDGKADAVDYVDSFNAAYNYGRLGFDPETALKNRGVLTEAQASEIYKSAIRIEADARQKAIDDINTKYSGGVTVAGKFDDSIIDYDNGTADNSRVNWSDLSSAQRNAITFAKGFSKATGVNIKFIKSKVVDGKHVGKNGSYNADTNTIEIDVYAGRMDAKVIEDSIIPTLSHEMTHWMKAKSPAMYAKMRAHIGETLALEGTSLEARIDAEIARMTSAHPDTDVTAEMAVDEIVARACEDMLSNSEKARELLSGLSESEQESFIDKVKETFQNLMKWVNDLLSQYKSTSKEAEILRQYEGRLKELSKMWDKALEESIKANQSLQKEGKTAEAVINQTLETIGLHYDAKSETVFSYRSLEDAFHMDTKNVEDFIKTKNEYVDALMKATRKSRTDCENYLNSLFLVHDMIGADRDKLDYEAAVNKSAWVSNSEYGGSIDFSTLCAKRRLFTGTMDAIIEQLPNTVLTDTDFLEIRNRLLGKELEAPCSMCYVEGSRAKNAIYINNWLTEYKKTNPKWIPQLADFTSTVRLEQTRLKHPEAYKAYQDAMNKLAQRKPKEASVRTDYKGEIRVAFADGTSVDIKNKNGGIRFNSFSDFEIIHALDCMQVVTDMATVGLAGQGYTKVKEFAECFGNTGMKINLSLVAKDVDADGNLIFDEVNGMKYDEAISLRNRYPKNVGTVIVAFNHKQLKAALRDSTIDYVLPFHRSQWRKAQYVLMGLPTEVRDYTMDQNDRITNPKTKKPVKLAKLKHVSTYTNDITGETFEITDNIMPNQYWDYNADGVTNARRYLSYINSNKMTPKFAFLLEKDAEGNWVLPTDADGNVTAEGKGYFKVLIDFKMYDNDGVGSPQTPVVPDFNMPYINDMLENYTGGHKSFPVAHDVVEQFVADYKKKHPKEQYSDRNLTDAQKKNYDYNQSRTAVGSSLKTLAGSTIKRYRDNVGKEVGGQVYFHKNYAEEIIPYEMYQKALTILDANHPDFEFNTLMYDKKKGTIRFDEAPDFDTAREPIAGNYVTVNVDDETTSNGYSDYIWHHKWEWVKNDYSGFDVAESWNWSKRWLSVLRATEDKVSNRGIANGSGHGTKNWNAQLEYFGLPIDGQTEDSTHTQYSLRIVEPIVPSNSKWQRGHDEAWFYENGFPLYRNVSDEQRSANEKFEMDKRKGGHGTQNASTLPTYENIFEYLKGNRSDWENIRVLDASAGLGLGTKKGKEEGFDIHDIEPFPNETYKPEWTDYDALQTLVEEGKEKPFDLIISNAVINVIAQDSRDSLVKTMASLLKDGGQMFINTIGKGYQGAKSATAEIQRNAKGIPVGTVLTQEAVEGGGREVFVWGSNSIQKVFSNEELKAYLEDVLGDGYVVDSPKKSWKGTKLSGTMMVVTKKANAQYSDRDSAYIDAVNRGDMETAQKMVDEAAKKAGYDVTPLFHGTGKFGFTKFDPAFSDDKSSFFLSDNALVSETYSGGKGKTRIADRSPISYDDLEDASPETILKLLKENVDRNIEIVSEEEHSRIVEENRDDLRTALSNLKKNIAKAKSDNERIKKISDDLIRHLEEMIEASNYNDFMDANANYDERMWALKWEDGDICDIILDDTHWYIQSAYRNLTTFLDNTMYKGNADLAKQKGSEYFTELEAITELHKNLFKGVYKLYAKPGKQFVVNADGNNWNRLDGRVIGKYGDVRTRDVAEYAKNNGYDSVVIKDVRDNADYTYSGTSNVYIYFDSNRLKSADPVTYDDNGNVIPLSERFNEKDADIRYSDRDSDGNQLTEAQQEFFKDSKVRDEDGNLRVVYHGSEADFTVFDRTKARTNMDIQGSFFSPWDIDAGGYGGKVRAFYLNIKNPASESMGYKALNKFKGQNGAGIKAREYLESLGYDGVNNGDEEYIAFYPEQIKEIANTNPTDDPDIRYSDREIDSWLDGLSIDDLIAELGFDDFDITDTKEKAKAERRVDEVNKRLKQIGLSFNGTKSLAWTDERIEKYLGGGYYGSSNPKYAQAYIAYMTPKQFLNLTMGGKTTTVDMIQNESASYGELDIEKLGGSSPMFLEIDEGRVWSKVVGHEGRHRMYLLGKAGFERVPVLLFDYKTKYDKTPKDEMKLIAQRYNDTDLISKSRNTAIGEVIPFSQGNKDLIKQKFGSGMEADIHYSDRDTDYIDSRTLLSNALESVAQTDDERDLLTEYRKNIDIISIKESELSEITAQIKELSFAKGERDAKKLEYLKSRAEKIRNSINYFDKKLLSLEAASPLKAVVDRERAKARKKAYEKNREYTKQTMSSYKEQLEKKAKIESITQKALVLNKWMLKNSKDEHIPEAMKPAIAHLIQAIDFSSKRLLNGGDPTKADVSLSQALAEVQKMVSKAEVDGDILFELYGSDMMAEMEVLVEAVNLYMRNYGDNEYVLNRMNLEQLKTLDKLVSTIKTSVSQMNQFHVVNSKKGVAHAGQQTMRHCEEVGQAKIHKNKFLNNVDKMLLWGNRTPYYAFRQFGESGQLVFEALQDGWDKFAFHIRKIKDYAEKTYNEKQVKEWSDEVHEFEVLLPATKAELADPKFKGNKQKVYLTTAQIMSLYCLQKRDQAVGHIKGGGIRITDIKTKKGVISQSEGVVLTEKELGRIIGTLTKDQITVADKLQKFMNEDCTVWGNEISMKRFGYKAFGEENYFPIRSDENVTGTDEVTEKEKTLYRLLNLSFTKSLTQNANNRIVVDNIFDVFAQHTSEMAKYNALALPVLDAVRWFNYKEKGEKVDTHFKTYSVKASIEKAFGKDAKSYINTFLQDINGAENVSRDSLGSGFMTNAKVASVGLNAKVVALQPTSYLRASAVIDNKYLVKGMAHKPKYKMAEKWCGMAQWKALGFIDINVQRGVADLIKHDKSFKDKASDFAMKGAEWTDQMTIGYLWNACEAEIRDTRKDLKVETDEYYTAVGKRLRDVIYATQVVDSTMTRSQMMRSPDKWDKVLTNFASEPTLSYNMLLDVYSDYKLTERKSGKKAAFNKCGKKFARAMYAYTITNALTALLELGFEIFRDDEEKDSEEVMKMYLENLALNQSILNKIPYAKEMISLLQGFSSSRMDTQWMQYFAYTINGVAKLMNGEGNAYTTLKNGIKATSYLSGIPFYNAWRDVNATLNKFNVLTLEEQEEMFNDTIGEMFPSLRIK